MALLTEFFPFFLFEVFRLATDRFCAEAHKIIANDKAALDRSCRLIYSVGPIWSGKRMWILFKVRRGRLFYSIGAIYLRISVEETLRCDGLNRRIVHLTFDVQKILFPLKMRTRYLLICGYRFYLKVLLFVSLLFLAIQWRRCGILFIRTTARFNVASLGNLLEKGEKSRN